MLNLKSSSLDQIGRYFNCYFQNYGMEFGRILQLIKQKVLINLLSTPIMTQCLWNHYSPQSFALPYKQVKYLFTIVLG